MPGNSGNSNGAGSNGAGSNGGSGGGTGGTGPSGGSGAYIGYAGNVADAANVRTEVHHIVEQCQVGKSGFSNSEIQASSNKVTLEYSLHRKISGYYSSKPDVYKGLRVRDWLAGQSFEAQTRFGWYIIQTYSQGGVP